MEHLMKPNSEKLEAFENEGGSFEDESQEVENGILKAPKVKLFLKEISIRSKSLYNHLTEFYVAKKTSIRRLSIAISIILFFIVLFQNVEESRFLFLFWGFSAPKIVVFSILLAIGAAFGYWLHSRNIINFEAQN